MLYKINACEKLWNYLENIETYKQYRVCTRIQFNYFIIIEIPWQENKK